jgi:gliding motility-associated-like protein
MNLRFTIGWDPTALSLIAPPTGFVDDNNLGLITAGNFYSDTLIGQFHFVGNASSAGGWSDLPQESTLFTLRFSYKDPSKISAINFLSLPTQTINATQAGTFANVPVFVEMGEIRANKDLIAPVLAACPPSIIVASASGCGQAVDLLAPMATDNCTNSATLVSSSFVGSTFPVGVTTVVFTAKDEKGNSSTCSTVVTVTGNNANLGPQFSNCPNNIILNLLNGPCESPAFWLTPTAFNNCDVNNFTITSTYNSGDIFAVGTTAVAYTVTDSYGHSAQCVFTVTARDLTPPIIHDCPSNVSVTPLIGECSAPADWISPTFTDNCSATVTSTVSQTAGEIFPVGMTLVTYTATDGWGNSATCNFEINIIDSTPPALSGCPTSVEVEANTATATGCGAIVEWIEPTMGAICSDMGNTLSANYTPGDLFPSGLTIVTYFVEHAYGVRDSCSFEVNVGDSTPPIFVNCPPNISVNAGNNTCEAPANWPNIIASDNCDNAPSLTTTHTTGQQFSAGTTTVLVIAQDARTNKDSCQFTVTVVGSGVPAFVGCPANQLFFGCESVANWATPATNGFCEPPAITSNFNSGTVFQAGINTVTYTATSTDGQTASCSFIINVNEAIAPIIACPGTIVTDVAGRIISNPQGFLAETDTVGGCIGVDAMFNNLTAADNCTNNVSVTQIAGKTSGSIFPLGDNVLTFQAMDAQGNSSTCNVVVKVVPISEIFDVKSNLESGCNGDEISISVDSIAGASYIWTGPKGPYSTTSDQISFDLDNTTIGTYGVSMLLNGCQSVPDSIDIGFVPYPTAFNDFLELAPGESAQLDVLENDGNPTKDGLIVSLANSTAGFELGSEGELSFSGSNIPDATQILYYNICSAVCPDRCTQAKVTILITDKECARIPNLMTPNTDGANDGFIIPCINADPNQMPDNNLVIYNQWGDRVFEASPYINDAEHAWDGTLFGQKEKYLPDGVYYYIFQPKKSSKTTIKGFIEIFR